MSKTLVVVESPSKAKTIQKYLGKEYVVRASFGHVRDLPEKEMGIELDNQFKPKYEVLKEKVKITKELQGEAAQATRVILASDPDREGEAIAWHLSALLEKKCSDIKRAKFNEITEEAIKEAVRRASEIDLKLVNSQQARRLLDRIVGYKLSPWLSNVLSGKLSAGRVQSVSLKIICDRDAEVKGFKAEEYWKIIAQLTPLNSSEMFEAELYQIGQEKTSIPNGALAEKIVEALKPETFIVSGLSKKERKRAALPPFITSTLQQEAVRKLRWDSKKVMKVAQELYEGVELAAGALHGLITYMRTDSTRVSEDFQKTTLSFIEKKWGKAYSPSPPNIYKTKGAAQDAHEAVRPTDASREPGEIKRYLTDDQHSLYKLIWERYVASQMSAAVYNTVAVNISAGKHLFKANGYSVKFDGFMILYVEDRDVEEGEDKVEEREKKLPTLEEKEALKVKKMDPRQKFTQPPPKFSEATLIKELERLGVGRPSTYAAIVSTLKDRGYVEIKKHKFEPTQLGVDIVKTLTTHFPEIMDAHFTAGMEEQLDLIAEGKENWVKVMGEFYTPFIAALKAATISAGGSSKESSGVACPNCGMGMAQKQGKYGPFLGCMGYPDCKTISSLKPKGESMGACDKCGKDMVLKHSKKDKGEEKFLGCSGYPDCKNSKPFGEKKSGVVSGETCGTCGKPMALKKSAHGEFYGCTGYPDCKATAPTEEKRCSQCKSPMEKKRNDLGQFWACTNFPDCRSTEKIGGGKSDKPPAKSTGEKCPKCGKDLVLRSGKNGEFHGCSGYPDCKTAISKK